MMLKIDHVALCSRNLYATADDLLAATGLASYDSGWFRGFGVAQRIVPLGNDGQFIEIESVIDPIEAASAEFENARYMAAQTVNGPKLLAFWLVTDDLDGVANRLDLKKWSLSKSMPDGTITRGENAPQSYQAYSRGLPAFMRPVRRVRVVDEREVDVPLEERTVAHKVEPKGIAWIELGGPQDEIRAWIGDGIEDIPLRLVGGPRGVRAMGISLADGTEAVIRPNGTDLGAAITKPFANSAKS